MKVKVYLFCSLIAACVLLQSCGFHLRGQVPLPTAFRYEKVYLESTTPYSRLTVQIRQILASLHTDLVSDSEQADIILSLFDEAYSRSTLSESASSKTKEYTLYLEVSYQLANNEREVIYGPETITTSRNYLVNEGQVLGSGNEQDILRQEMQRDVAYQLLNQLASNDVQVALDNSTD